MYKLIYCFVILFIIESCSISSTKKRETLSSSSNEYLESDTQNESNSKSSINSNVKSNIDLNRQLIKRSHHINTSANEYLPVLSADENKMYFSAMDRTGFFDFKVDYTKQISSFTTYYSCKIY